MSRTREFNLPRIPDTSPHIVATVTALSSAAASSLEAIAQEQNQFKSFLGTRRQDVTSAVLADSVMFDDIFCKQGRLEEQNVPKASLPLTCRPYNSLHDKHVRQLYVRNPKLRKHLVDQGLITAEMRICSTKREVHEKIRSHEMLERKELLKQQMDDRERQRLARLQQAKVTRPTKLPPVLDWSQRQERKRQAMKVACTVHKAQSARKKAEEEALKERIQKQLQHQNWLKHLEEQELEQERRRQAEIVRQQELRSAHYDRKFGNLPRGQQLAEWHKTSDVLHSRMIFMQHQVWWPPYHQASTDNEGQASTDSFSMESLQRHLPHLLPSMTAGHSDVAMATSQVISQTSVDGGATRKDVGAMASTSSARGDNAAAASSKATRDTPTASMASASSGKGLENRRSRAAPGEEAFEKVARVGEELGEASEQVRQGGGADATDGAGVPEDADFDAPPPPQDELEMHILTALQSVDEDNSGFITAEDVLIALQLHCEILEFHEGHMEALQQLSADLVDAHHHAVHGPEGCMSYQHAVADITDLLRQASADAVAELYPSGSAYMWSQLPDALAQHTLWFNRETGELALERPLEDQPVVRDEFFEDTMVNMFIEYDQNGDNLLDRNEFLKLLQSTGVGSRLTTEQVEELWMLFAQSSVSSLDFDQFVPFARLLILRIYSNQYQSEEEWIELSCPICPRFWYSKITGQCILLPPDIPWGAELDEQFAGAEAADGGAGAGAARGRVMQRSDSAYGHLVGDPSTLKDRKILQPVPAPPAPSRQHNSPVTLAAISEEAASLPSRPGSALA